MEVFISAQMMSYGRAGMMIVGDTLMPCLAPIYPTMLFAANLKQDPLMNCHFTVLNHKQVDNMLNGTSLNVQYFYLCCRTS